VLPTPAARAVRLHVPVGREAELVGHAPHDQPRHVGRVVEEGAEEAHRAELHGAAEPHVGAAMPADEGAVGVVEEEVAGELLGRGVAGVTAVASLLLLGEEADRHGAGRPGYRPSNLRARSFGPPLPST
jgi:hypothetical protein